MLLYLSISGNCWNLTFAYHNFKTSVGNFYQNNPNLKQFWGLSSYGNSQEMKGTITERNRDTTKRIPPPTEQRRIIRNARKGEWDEYKKGELFYLVNTSWWNEWKSFVSFESEIYNIKEDEQHQESKNYSGVPEKINNSHLLEAVHDGNISNKIRKLQENLIEGIHYFLLPEPVWEQLCDW